MWIIIATVLVVLLAVYFYREKYTYFERRGIPYAKPFPFVGAFLEALTFQRSIPETLQRVYNLNRDAKYVGFLDFCTPALLIRDLDLIKFITIKNFDHFTDHAPLFSFDNFKRNSLFNLRGVDWKHTRKLISPVFSSKKIKEVFPMFAQTAKRYAAYLSALPADQRIIDLMDVVTRYTCDSIASSTLGLEVDSITNSKNDFLVNGGKFSSSKRIIDVKILIRRNFQKISNMLGIYSISNEIAKIYKDVLTLVMKVRDETGAVHQDTLQSMMNMKEKGLTDDDIFANLMFFISANFMFSAPIISHSIFELAANQKAQKRLQDEIDQVLSNCNGEVTLDAINDMKYMEAVVNETLRMYPAISLFDRTCTKRFELPPTLPTSKPYVIEEGESLFVSIYAINRDPDYFPEPNQFNPERFCDDPTKSSRSAMSLAFGMGPRMCVGNRVAVTLTKTMLFYILADCEVKPCSKSVVPTRISPLQLRTLPADTLWINIEPRNKQLLNGVQ